MQTTYVREFLVMAEMLNYAEAAKKLYLSHTSLYKHMKVLEDDVGGSLFERIGNNVFLSEYGQIFLPHARRLIKEEDWCIGDLSEWKANDNDSLTLITDYRIVDLIYQFRKKYPNCTIHNLEVDSVDTAANMLVRGNADAALLCSEHLDEDMFFCIPYKTDYLAVVLASDHPLAGESSIRLSQLAKENFIMLPSNSCHTKFCEKAFIDAHFTPHISLTCARGDAVVKNIIRGEGCSIMMAELTATQEQGGIAIVPLEPRVEIKVDLWVRKYRRNPRIIQNFADFITQSK